MTGPNLRIRLSNSAKRDLDRRWKWLAQESSPATADRFLDAVDRTIELLRTLPGMGRVFRVQKSSVLVRRIAVTSPFERWVVFYTVHPAELRIERVLHSAQDLTNLLR